jgi:hypothetical protein
MSGSYEPKKKPPIPVTGIVRLLLGFSSRLSTAVRKPLSTTTCSQTYERGNDHLTACATNGPIRAVFASPGLPRLRLSTSWLVVEPGVVSACDHGVESGAASMSDWLRWLLCPAALMMSPLADRRCWHSGTGTPTPAQRATEPAHDSHPDADLRRIFLVDVHPAVQHAAPRHCCLFR